MNLTIRIPLGGYNLASLSDAQVFAIMEKCQRVIILTHFFQLGKNSILK